MTEADWNEMKIDEIFALYLFRLSNRVNEEYWKKSALPFVILFRECLNEYGWSKKFDLEKEIENNPGLNKEIENKQFCIVNNAELDHEICNEFVTVYMECK